MTEPVGKADEALKQHGHALEARASGLTSLLERIPNRLKLPGLCSWAESPRRRSSAWLAARSGRRTLVSLESDFTCRSYAAGP